MAKPLGLEVPKVESTESRAWAFQNGIKLFSTPSRTRVIKKSSFTSKSQNNTVVNLSSLFILTNVIKSLGNNCKSSCDDPTESKVTYSESSLSDLSNEVSPNSVGPAAREQQFTSHTWFSTKSQNLASSSNGTCDFFAPLVFWDLANF